MEAGDLVCSWFLNFNAVDILGERILCGGVVVGTVGCLAVLLASTH